MTTPSFPGSTAPRSYTPQEVDATRVYYQQFHHTVIGWFLTVSGLFFAGLLALDTENITNGLLVLWVVLPMLVLTGITFLYVIARFAARIDNLHVFANEPAVRGDWMEKHKDGFYDAAGSFKRHRYSLAGVGCRFFVALMTILTGGNVLLAILRIA